MHNEVWLFFFFCVLFLSCGNKKDVGEQKATDSSKTAGQPMEPQQKQKIAEDTTIVFDWNRDGKPDSFVLRGGGACSWCIDTMTIKISGSKDTVFIENDPKEPGSNFTLIYADESLIDKNLLQSDQLAFLSIGKKPNNLVCLYANYETSPEEIQHELYYLNDKNAIVKLFSETVSTFKILDINGDHNNMVVADLGGWPSLESHLLDKGYDFHFDEKDNPGGMSNFNPSRKNHSGGYVESYHPFWVYELSDKKELKLDTALSINYTKKQNHGFWCGFRSTGDTVLYKPSRKQPVRVSGIKEATIAWNKAYGAE